MLDFDRLHNSFDKNRIKWKRNPPGMLMILKNYQIIKMTDDDCQKIK